MATPSVALAQVMNSPGPMHSGMEPYGPHGMGPGNCPVMQSMMLSATAPSDRAMMQSMYGMHQEMLSMKFTGNADRDFLTMMIPHHQGAIGMAQAELKFGKDAKIKNLAQLIMKAQQTEINEMQVWLSAK